MDTGSKERGDHEGPKAVGVRDHGRTSTSTRAVLDTIECLVALG